jgi:hypothetical protein
MKNQLMIKTIAGTAMVLGSLNANVPSYTSTSTAMGMKSKKGSQFGAGLSQDSNTGTLMNANVPSYEKQPKVANDRKVTLNSFGGGAYQDGITGTLTRID